MAYVRGYQHDASDVTQMREYAGCIERLYPEQMSRGELGAAKAGVFLLFIAVFVGIIWEWNAKSVTSGPVGAIGFGGLIGFTVGLCCLAAAAGLFYGAKFLIG